MLRGSWKSPCPVEFPLFLLSDKLKRNVQWKYVATSHGKGVAMALEVQQKQEFVSKQEVGVQGQLLFRIHLILPMFQMLAKIKLNQQFQQ